VLAAGYRDKGGRNAPPLVGQSAVVLRPTTLEAESANDGRYGRPCPKAERTTHVRLPLPARVNDLAPGDVYLVWKGEGGVVEDDMGHHRPGDVGFLDWVNFE